MKVVIMAGGKGTRISELARDIPKPMMKIKGKPILEYQINCLLKMGLKEILIITGYLSNAITSYFNDGTTFGVHITYFQEPVPLGTAGALFKCMESLTDPFILLNGDVIFDLDFSRLITAHYKKGALATLVSHPNSHPYDSALLVTDSELRVTQWINKEDTRLYYKNRVNAGIQILTKELLEIAKKNIPAGKVDLDRDILKPCIATNRIFAYDTPEYIKDMGTPERYHQVEHDLEDDLVTARNLSKKQRAIFLDRDGTINRLNGFVTKPEDLHLLPGAAYALKKINNSPYLAIIITNQPVIARGECTIEELETIHKKMESDLGKEGAFLDALYFCPHHPDKGFPGERSEYKIDCECRKPKPGMLFEAAKKFNIDLSTSWMVGDNECDILAGKAAGCKAVLIGKGVNTVEPDLQCDSLKLFVTRYLLKEYKE
ncbi:MAG: HAD-IIIA family hydrolase [Treponema sp.]|jgi:D,D-heptose 1,7-bisphosphate phosphatase|nr:HAD-IIIA family hydrolase [Treponema sp.]